MSLLRLKWSCVAAITWFTASSSPGYAFSTRFGGRRGAVGVEGSSGYRGPTRRPSAGGSAAVRVPGTTAACKETGGGSPMRTWVLE